VASYYYLMSQLPYLIYGQAPPMSSDSFKALAASIMSESDTALMDHLYLDPAPLSGDEGPAYAEHTPSCGCDFIDNWREWERAFRLNAARRRALKSKRDGGAPVDPPAFPADAASAAAKATSGEDSPLDAEILADKARWNAIEAFAGNDYFDRNSAFAYYLKLALLERKALFKTEEGFAEYKSLYASILEDVQSCVGEPK
jgi:hypothetical protein